MLKLARLVLKMLRMNRWQTLAVGLVLCIGQAAAFAQDTVNQNVLPLQEVLQIVEKHHPISMQAALLPVQAQQQLVRARAGFDPMLFSNLDEKEFANKDYYLLNESGLKVPVWFGEVKATYEINRGIQLNDQNEIPNAGLTNLGVSIPLAEGLWIDDRRAVLKQAKIFVEATDFARLALMNNLYFDAAKTYWAWAEAYARIAMLNDAMGFATDQLDFVKSSVIQGDQRAMDTVEATIQVQNIMMELTTAELEFKNTALELANFLWLDGQIPLEIAEGTIPQPLSETSLQQLSVEDSLLAMVEGLGQLHPELRMLQMDISALDVQRRLKVNQLLPTANINYNLLSATGFNFAEGSPSEVFLQNYKWGFQLNMPLFWGKERADLKLAKLKLQEAGLKLDLKTYQQQNKVRFYYNELITLRSQVSLNERLIANYNALLLGERELFANGESSLFVINSRQTKLIEAQQKLLALQSKYQKALAALLWALGGSL